MPPFFDIHGDPNMDPYTILSLPPTATDAEIKKAYRMQMLQLHPDKLAPTLGDQSIAAVTEKFHNVKDAYEFLVSPMHLTSRRLYMAKMASRRAEYERREAFMRRNGGVGDNYTAYASRGGVSGYRSGGGGAAGMAGTGMPNTTRHTSHGNGHSYPVPPRRKSEPDFDKHNGGENKDHRGNRRGGGGATGMYKNNTRGADRGRTSSNQHHGQQHTSKRKDNKGKERPNGYKSDSAGHTKTKSNIREGRSSKPRSKNSPTSGQHRDKEHRDKEKQSHRQRTKSEPRHRHNRDKENEGEKKATSRDNRKSRADRDTTTREQQSREQKERKRRRAKSAPARCSRSAKYNKYDKSSSNNDKNLPKEFFCPLTKRVMKDPVVDAEGNIYEREAIERWLRVQSSSPITNSYLTLEMLRPERELKRAIYKTTGKPRSKSQSRTESRSNSPTDELISGRVLIDSYLREISSKSKLSVSLDGMGICAFSYRRITFVIEVPITPHAGFMVYSSFDGAAHKYKLSEKMDAWNTWLKSIGRHSRVSHVKAGQKTVFTLKGSERDMSRCDVFQKTLEYFVEMSLKLHNLLHPMEVKEVENVCLTRAPVAVA